MAAPEIESDPKPAPGMECLQKGHLRCRKGSELESQKGCAGSLGELEGPSGRRGWSSVVTLVLTQCVFLLFFFFFGRSLESTEMGTGPGLLGSPPQSLFTPLRALGTIKVSDGRLITATWV